MPSHDVKAATRLVDASWRPDSVSKATCMIYIIKLNYIFPFLDSSYVRELSVIVCVVLRESRQYFRHKDDVT